jgi:hypothetical protein
MVEINDIRVQSEFSNISFSKFKKSEVKKELTNNLLKGHIEPACHWCAEFVCAGHFSDLWDIFLLFFGKHIHVGNPKILIYLQKRFELFKSIMSNSDYITDLHARNNDKLRELFAEIVCVLCLSKKQYSIEPVKINRKEEFDITNLSEHLVADSTKYALYVYKTSDPKELFIAFNEFIYNIEQKNCRKASWWIEWLLEYDLICRKKKQQSKCEERFEYNVLEKHRRDIVWIIWDIFFYFANLNDDRFVINVLSSLLDIFCIKYTTACCKKRRFLLYFGVTLFTEHINRNEPIIADKTVIPNVIANINQIYKDIKKNEESPNMEYLFSNVDDNDNMEKSKKRIEYVNSISLS